MVNSGKGGKTMLKKLSFLLILVSTFYCLVFTGKCFAQSGGQNNYADVAISQGYKVCFQNAGIHHRLGKLNSKLYSEFQKTLEPGKVKACEPKTFAWVDGAARAHMVMCIVCTESPSTWSMNVSQDNRAETQGKLKGAEADGESGQVNGQIGQSQARSGMAATTFTKQTAYNIADTVSAKKGADNAESGAKKTKSASDGKDQSQQKISKSSKDTEGDQIKSVANIIHSQTLYAMNFQFHMGSPIKSIMGDIDVMTFYPPVAAMAVASLNYTGKGKINRGGGSEDAGSDPNFEAGLIGAF
jgi:hypothetical protein